MVSLRLIFPLHFSATITIFIISISLGSSNDVSNCNYKNCSPLFTCGKLQNVGYPFWGAGRPSCCGLPELELICPHNHSDYPTITFKPQEYLDIPQTDGIDLQNVSYRVLNIHKSDQDMFIQLQELPLHGTCPILFSNASFHEIELFHYSSSVLNISLFYDCPKGQIIENTTYSATCLGNRSNNITYYLSRLSQSENRNNNRIKSCKHIKVPVLRKVLDDLLNGNRSLSNVLEQGFELEYAKPFPEACSKCKASGGICVSSNVSDFLCYCKDKNLQPTDCKNSGKRKKWILLLVLGITLGILILLTVNAGICYYYKKPKLHSPRLLSRIISSDPANSDVENSNAFYSIPVFSYQELQEATNNFDPAGELGDGGFGIVYYGKLKDGREVAVKRLYEKNYKRVGQFKNEVEILTNLGHPNLVDLFGCTSRHSRELLLVYEYIPNGTVADHLYGDQSESKALTWTIRMKIAIETASALSYLHASDIIHRDVKTHNILLDSYYSVKVADFGLSRLFPCDATHVSTAPQGTPGYLDPEYHKCYQVTNKSDVYSFGVVLIELISSLPAVDISRNEDEINLSDYAMKRIQKGELGELVDPKLGFESDFKVKRMTTLVAELAFRCLQQEKEVRPSMEEVLEGLRQIERIDYEALEAEETGRSMGRTKPSSDNDKDATQQHIPRSPSSVMTSWVSGSTVSNPSG